MIDQNLYYLLLEIKSLQQKMEKISLIFILLLFEIWTLTLSFRENHATLQAKTPKQTLNTNLQDLNIPQTDRFNGNFISNPLKNASVFNRHSYHIKKNQIRQKILASHQDVDNQLNLISALLDQQKASANKTNTTNTSNPISNQSSTNKTVENQPLDIINKTLNKQALENRSSNDLTAKNLTNSSKNNDKNNLTGTTGQRKPLDGYKQTKILANPENNLTFGGQVCLQKCKNLGGISCKKGNDIQITCCKFLGCQWPLACERKSLIQVDGCINIP